MSLMGKLEYVSKLPREVSQETKDKASIEVIVNHVKTTKAYHKKRPYLDSYSPYSPLLEEVIKGETTFNKELKKFLKKYGRGQVVRDGKHKIRLMDGSGYTKFAFQQGNFAIFKCASAYLDESTKVLDKELERLRQGLIEKLY